MIQQPPQRWMLTHFGKIIWLLANWFVNNGFGMQTGFGSHLPAVTGCNGDSNEINDDFAGAGLPQIS